MNLYFDKPEKMIKIIEWVRNNEEVWEVISTPNNSKISGSEVKQLIDLFVRDNVSEMIFLMLHLQRKLPYVKRLMENMAIYLISLRWDNEQQAIIKKMRSLLNK